MPYRACTLLAGLGHGLAAGLLGVIALAGSGERATASEAAWTALARPGAVAVMRHALAPGTGDPAEFTLGDCSTQRNLDARGRAQAETIGEALRARGISFDQVLTSQWCRCRETATLLAMGQVDAFPALNSFFQQRAQREPQTRDTLAYLRALPEEDSVLLVTHQVNITALTGVYPSSGEIVVGRIGTGGFEVAGTIEFAY
ncbi:histidine phosphatase family protein [Stappia stellulata]|uniref:histidine phosphatase family protein n=1 Tax=Stappia stellulata TaxID=71235 RepID=UPI001CD7D5A1|nr:histidine phosphatase family protein [Stappia stellulata]MCA1242752.1 histidine phosphatase family protein [Stappia stellulata]